MIREVIVTTLVLCAFMHTTNGEQSILSHHNSKSSSSSESKSRDSSESWSSGSSASDSSSSSETIEDSDESNESNNTPESAEENGCPSLNSGEAVLLPHKDCSKYYVCDWGKKIEMNCPDGLHFNPKLSVCDWPKDAGCESSEPQPTKDPNPNECPAVNEGEAVFFPHKDCTKYYVCDWGKKIEMNCPDGLHFNPKLNVCDWPKDAGCQAGNTDEPPAPTEGNTQEPPATTEGSGESGECPANNEGEVVFFPHEDCSKYYVCDWGKKVEMNCPEGLHFNPKLNVCDWPKDAGCEAGNTEGPPATTEGNTQEPPATTEGSGESGECPANNEGEVVFFPHEDCSKYYVCDWGKKVEMNCPEGLHFNPKLNVCDWPKDAGCEAGNTEGPPATTEGNTQEPPATTEGSGESGECPANNEGEVVFFPHEDCSKYYVCDWGKKVEMNCPEGLHFNPKLNVCDWPKDAGCEAGNTEGPPATTEGSVQPGECPANNEGEVVFFPHEDCSKYYVCDWGKKVEMNCPKGLHFNPNLNVCDWPKDAGCEAGNTEGPPATTEGNTQEPPATTEGSGESGECPANNEGEVVFFPHEDCSKYYVCDWGKKVEMNCPEGLHFNPKLNVCDWPKDAGCEAGNTEGPPATTEGSVQPGECPANNEGEVVFFPHEDCSKYYVCDWGKKVEMNCPEGLHFNPNLNVCDWPKDAGCEAGNTEGPPATTEGNTQKPPATTEGSGESGECPANNEGEVVFFPHEDCSKYYVCDWGKKVEMNCPEGLHFNPKLNVCDWPKDAGCEAGNTEGPPATTEGNTQEPPATTEGSGESGECPANNEGEVVFFPHEDCSKYYVCDWGKKVEMNCPEGLHFNPKLNVCDWPKDAGCEAGNTEGPPATTEGNTQEPPATTEGSGESGECPANNEGEVVFFPHEDCSKYYVCDWGKKVEMNCPEGLHFNPKLNVCDWPKDAGCEAGNTEGPPATTEGNTQEPPATTEGSGESGECPANNEGEVVFFPHEDCSKYYVCDWGKKVEMNCPGGLHFNPKLNVCDWPKDAGCEAGNTEGPPATTEGSVQPGECPANNEGEVVFFPHEDCSKYYVCDWGKKVEMNCPDGLHFNPKLNVCDWPKDAGCEAGNTEGPPATTEGNTQEPPATTEGSGESGECPANNEGEVVFFPHEDCSKFYVCDWGKKVEMNCPEGLHFNPKLNVCDWPKDAGCEAGNTEGPPATTEGSVQPGECPANNEGEVVFFPHEDCSKYYVCDWGKKVEMNCPEGLHFNPKLNVCDWPKDAGCEAGNTEGPPATTEGNTQEPPATTEGSGESGECPANNEGEVVFFPHEECSKYYVCDWGKKVEMNCPEGLHFNPKLNVCDWPKDAGCEAGNTEGPPATTEGNTQEPPATTEGSGESGECPANNEGEVVFFPHEDCSKYYVCDWGKKVEMNCPEGLHFNPKLNVCDWPKDAGCEAGNTEGPPATTEGSVQPGECPANNEGEVVFFPHEDCSKYYVCDWGKKVEMNCPEGLHFNPKLNVCDWPKDAGCEAGNTEGPPATTEGNTQEPPASTEGSGESGECPANNEGEVVFFPHEDCSKYYVCDWGKKVEMNCPEGLHFNPKLNVCDWPNDAGCEAGNTEGPPATTEGSVQPGECPANNEGEVVFFPHEDCSKYYVCDWGKKVEMNCPDGLHFNPKLNVCDWPKDAGCEAGNTEGPPATTEGNTQEPPATTEGSGESGECPANNEGEVVFFPHEDCSKYYVCDWGKKVEMNCPEGLHFNPKLNVCDWPKDAGCEAGNTEGPPATTEGSGESGECPANNEGEVVFFPHEDCSKYYVCDWGKKVEMNCPEGLHFNPKLNVCDWPKDAGCEAGNTEGPPATTEGNTQEPPATTEGSGESGECPTNNEGEVVFFPHEDCSKYYVCDWGKKVEMNCPEGLHFNPKLNVCDWPKDAGCEAGNTEGPPATTEGNTQEPPATTEGSGESGECPANNEGEVVFFPHEDCSKYYVCDWGKKVEMNCPEGLHFNPKLNVCDWPKDVGCEAGNTEGPPATTEGSGESGECPANNEGEVVFFPHEDCSKYYVCDWGKKVEMNCPEGLHFNPKLNVCDWPKDAGCEAGNTEGPPATTEGSVQPGECPANNEGEVVFFPHEDCSKYYVCDWGKKVEMNCPEGLHFNPKLNVCDWPKDAGCEAGNTEGPPATTEGNTQEPPATTEGSGESGECPANNEGEVVFFPHEDCSKYYVCDWGKKVEMNCPEGLHFNPKLNVCDWPKDAGCEAGNTEGPPATTEGNTQEPPATTEGSGESGECPANNEGEVVFFPHEDCSKYYVCDWGKKVEMNCPEGLHFNPKLNVCDWPKDAGCEAGNTEGPPATTEGSVQPGECPANNEGEVVFFPHEDCSKYYVCDWGKKVEMICPDGLHFDPKLKVCDWPCHAGCESSTEKPAPTEAPKPSPKECSRNNEGEVEFIPHEDCTKYYVCDWGKKIEMRCPGGLHFNPKLNVCDWPRDAGCQR